MERVGNKNSSKTEAEGETKQEGEHQIGKSATPQPGELSGLIFHPAVGIALLGIPISIFDAICWGHSDSPIVWKLIPTGFSAAVLWYLFHRRVMLKKKNWVIPSIFACVSISVVWIGYLIIVCCILVPSVNSGPTNISAEIHAIARAIAEGVASMSQRNYIWLQIGFGSLITFLVWFTVITAIRRHGQMLAAADRVRDTQAATVRETMAVSPNAPAPEKPVQPKPPVTEPIIKPDETVTDISPPNFYARLRTEWPGEHVAGQSCGMWVLSNRSTTGKRTAYPINWIACIEIMNRGDSPLVVDSYSIEMQTEKGNWRNATVFPTLTDDALYFVVDDPRKAHQNSPDRFFNAVVTRAPINKGEQRSGWIFFGAMKRDPPDNPVRVTQQWRITLQAKNGLQSTENINRPPGIHLKQPGIAGAFFINPAETDLTKFPMEDYASW
jgi:hypothetical protein